MALEEISTTVTTSERTSVEVKTADEATTEVSVALPEEMAVAKRAMFESVVGLIALVIVMECLDTDENLRAVIDDSKDLEKWARLASPALFEDMADGAIAMGKGIASASMVRRSFHHNIIPPFPRNTWRFIAPFMTKSRRRGCVYTGIALVSNISASDDVCVFDKATVSEFTKQHLAFAACAGGKDELAKVTIALAWISAGDLDIHYIQSALLTSLGVGGSYTAQAVEKDGKTTIIMKFSEGTNLEGISRSFKTCVHKAGQAIHMQVTAGACHGDEIVRQVPLTSMWQ
ncbi:MAG: hypothetical protein V6Z86_09705 [Hyphomicrobiales bacterium]